MMDANVVSASGVPLTVEKDVSAYPIYFGVSCAFVALQILEEKRTDFADAKWSIITDKMLRGSAQLLGLLVWKAQRGEAEEERIKLLNQLKKAETEIAELRLRRTEDAKANEKVVAIFASQEQSWICERKGLRLQIQALVNEFRKFDTRNKQNASNLNNKIKEMEVAIQSREKALEEDEKRRQELEEVVEELRETVNKEAQAHSAELWKHKTAFIELVSNQRQLEADMGRAVRQFECTKQELDSVFEQKEEAATMVEKVSVEIAKLQKDAEQKDKILSAMLRKSKLDTSEKQILLKEIKICKTRRKQAELDSERWKARSEVGNENHLRGKSGNRTDFRSERLAAEKKAFDSIEVGCSQNRNGLNPRELLLEFLEADQRKEIEFLSPKELDDTRIESCLGELAVPAEVKQLEDWIRLESRKYTSIIEQRHCSEVDAFAEQMRLKDEKLEVFRWHLLSLELQSKRLRSHIEVLEENVTQFREGNMKLEALLLDKEKELKTLKEKWASSSQKSRTNNTSYNARFQSMDPMALWSEVKIIKRKLEETGSDELDTLYLENQQTDLVVQADDRKGQTTTLALPSSDFEGPSTERSCKKTFEELEKIEEKKCENKSAKLSLTMQPSEKEIEEEKEVVMDPCQDRVENLPSGSRHEAKADSKSTSDDHCTKKDSSWKIDLQALGVSYKIKRLKQQLLLLERLTGTHAVTRPVSNEDSGYEPGRCEIGKNEEQAQQVKGVLLMISLLNKQVKRYQSLEEKTNDLCKRLDNRRHDGWSDSNLVRAKKGTETLENFLEETFQLQRYMVATGQKLTEIQSRISSNFSGGLEGIEKCENFDIRQFADNVRTLFREIQRGLEIRISRIIGDLEGTLACEGILHLRI
ncbi:uncharacterized protein [Aristolochia californica]|uniref:uncharacterized protein n=1 Tax=Aristolochia californica TaxID=171875 RepID=UPI0035DCBEAC